MIQTNQHDGLDQNGNSPQGEGDGLSARFIAWVVHHFPPGQFGRYLVVGLCNTVFGYSTYVLLTFLLTPYVPYPYVVAIVFAYFLNVTFSFLSYKWFIFKTGGNYLSEWIRCLTVYIGGVVLGTALLPAAVFGIRRLTPFNASAPYVAGALLMGINVIVGFLGHKNFSFSPSRDACTGIHPMEK
jgi:putative flippase GtrA